MTGSGVIYKMGIRTKQTLIATSGVLLISAFVAFAILCPWSGLVWLVIWIITLTLYAGARGRNEQLQIINNKLTSELQRVVNSASIAQTHSEILVSIIDKMEEENISFSESAADIVQEMTNKKEENKDGE